MRAYLEADSAGFPHYLGSGPGTVSLNPHSQTTVLNPMRPMAKLRSKPNPKPQTVVSYLLSWTFMRAVAQDLRIQILDLFGALRHGMQVLSFGDFDSVFEASDLVLWRWDLRSRV